MGIQYTQPTESNRWSIQSLLSGGHSQRSVALALGVSPSTISREVRRARLPGSPFYQAGLGQNVRVAGRKRAGRARRKIDVLWRSPCARHVMAHLRENWSLTYDQGTEIALHDTLARRLRMDIFFCDPHSP